MDRHALAIDAFLPTRVMGRLDPTDSPGRSEQGVAAAGRPVTSRGASLFVDIRGYTDLTERLCRAGPEGVERLKRQRRKRRSHSVWHGQWLPAPGTDVQ